MNAFRKTRLLVVLSVLSLVIVGLAAGSAQANGGCYTPKYCGPSYSSYCSYPSYCNTSYCYPSYNYCNYGSYNYCNFTPATYCAPQQYCFPVTVYDCYGRPTIVWQTTGGQTIYNASFGGVKLVQ